MTRARKDLIHLNTTPYYHCISRCVRRAFLSGSDKFTEKSFDHRKQWLVSRFAELAEIFAIEICAYAVMATTIIWYCASTPTVPQVGQRKK